PRRMDHYQNAGAMWLLSMSDAIHTKFASDFQGAGVITEEAVVRLSRLKIRRFVELAELVARSELRNLLEEAPDSSIPFRVMTPDSLTALGELFQHLLKTEAARRLLAKAA
ncbi:MAG: hypothetical protein NC930_05740, partial [Candidatus Omnitrophica bacterium]|nr:hypothetical protein [Candidatus Omnitrophota bacterium]